MISTVGTNNDTGLLAKKISFDTVASEWIMNFNVNGLQPRAKVDTGATAIVKSSFERERVSLKTPLKLSQTKLAAYSVHNTLSLSLTDIALRSEKYGMQTFHVIGAKLKAQTVMIELRVQYDLTVKPANK